MSIQRLSAAAAALTAVLLAGGNAFASTPPEAALGCVEDAMDTLIATAPAAAESAVLPTPAVLSVAPAEPPKHVSPRQLLADFAMKLRDIRYRRGGRAPNTGFDCSGFVHYVFSKALGIDLPDNSASQFNAGVKVARDEMQTGDLVFFHIHGKRVSHVGIYLGDGRFIHSPATGERVHISRLDEDYWARRFAGAKRMESVSS